MAATTRPDAETPSDSDSEPEISACRSCPGRVVFLESGNTDGWISSDTTVDVTR